MERNTFWMVYGLNQRSPVVRHKTEDSALREAARLARQNPETAFYVMEATHRLRRNDVLVETLGQRCYSDRDGDGVFDDGIPF
jgi:hypothetical protein